MKIPVLLTMILAYIDLRCALILNTPQFLPDKTASRLSLKMLLLNEADQERQNIEFK